jgi:NADH:ubiquinone oxidoreductase subunit H
MLSVAFVRVVMPPIAIVVPPVAVLHLAVVVPPVAVVVLRRFAACRLQRRLCCPVVGCHGLC